MIDSQSVKTTESGGPGGFDAVEKLRVASATSSPTDTQGNMIGLSVCKAIQDRDDAEALTGCLRYAGEKLRMALKRIGE